MQWLNGNRNILKYICRKTLTECTISMWIRFVNENEEEAVGKKTEWFKLGDFVLLLFSVVLTVKFSFFSM